MPAAILVVDFPGLLPILVPMSIFTVKLASAVDGFSTPLAVAVPLDLETVLRALMILSKRSDTGVVIHALDPARIQRLAVDPAELRAA